MLSGTDVRDELCEVAEICGGTSLISSTIISSGVHHLHELRRKRKLSLLLFSICRILEYAFEKRLCAQQMNNWYGCVEEHPSFSLTSLCDTAEKEAEVYIEMGLKWGWIGCWGMKGGDLPPDLLTYPVWWCLRTSLKDVTPEISVIDSPGLWTLTGSMKCHVGYAQIVRLRYFIVYRAPDLFIIPVLNCSIRPCWLCGWLC